MELLTYSDIVLITILSIVGATILTLQRLANRNNENIKYTQKDSILDLKNTSRILCSFCKSEIYFIGKNKTLCPFCDTYN